MKYEKSAGVIVYKKEANELKFLLLEAPSISEKNPHTIWSFPKGQIENNQNDLQTALRELQEETGIANVRVVPDFKAVDRFLYKRDGEFVSKTVVYFLAESDPKQEVMISLEHIGYVWASEKEALKLIKIKSIKDTLIKAQKHLSENTQLNLL